MSEHETPDAAQTYRIGAVARLTGIPPDTLRVWERRYAVVVPIRSASGTRLYAAEDVQRLTLIKRLVDHGDAISHVAGLSLVRLRERVHGLKPGAAESTVAVPCRVAVLGSALPAMLALERKSGHAVDERIEFVGLFEDAVRFRDEAARLRPDLVVLECPSIQADQISHLADLVTGAGGARGVVIYGFATRAVVERLEALHLIARPGPVDATELRRWCRMLHAGAWDAPPPADVLADLNLGGPIPARRFDMASLTRLATISQTVHCECPRHLVALISSLAAFEAYSRECESRHVDDAALHAFLHAATAQARATMEAALARLVEAEGIVL